MNAKITKEVKTNYSGKLSDNEIIEKYFYFKSNLGEEFIGLDGFSKKSFLEKEKNNLLDDFKSLEILKNKNEFGLIDLSLKLKDKFKDQKFLEKLFILEPYTFSNLGKTKYGHFMHLIKGNSDIEKIKYFSELLYEKYLLLNKKYNFDYIAVIPPTLKGRKIQFMDFIRDYFYIKNSNIKFLDISKIDGMPSQKSLSKFNDRLENAKNSFYYGDKNLSGKNILIIDDAVGSGTTINFVAEKLLQKNNFEKIYGLAVIGSLRGFDIIREI